MKTFTLEFVRGLPSQKRADYVRSFADDKNVKVVGVLQLQEFYGKVVNATSFANTLRPFYKYYDKLVVDNMNLYASEVKAVLEVFKDVEPTLVYTDFREGFDKAVAFDKSQGSPYGEAYIRKVNAAFRKFPPRPTLPQNHSELFAPYVADISLPEAVLLDVDGTAMLISPKRGLFDWHKVNLDAPNVPVLKNVRALQAAGVKVVVMSGRSDKCYADTLATLEAQGVEVHELHMRKDLDERPDWVVKGEMFNAYVRERFNVIFCLDDRDQVVDFYRKTLGLTVFQVNYGNF